MVGSGAFRTLGVSIATQHLVPSGACSVSGMLVLVGLGRQALENRLRAIAADNRSL
jgi:hypothetical protein